MARLTDEMAIIPLYEAKDWTAGADSDSFELSKGAVVDIILNIGALTAPGAVTVFSGATVGAKTTALPFTYRLSGADYAAAGADLFGADVAETDGILTVNATGHDHRLIVLSFSAADLPAGHKWITLATAAGTAQVMSALALVRGVRYLPPATAL